MLEGPPLQEWDLVGVGPPRLTKGETRKCCGDCIEIFIDAEGNVIIWYHDPNYGLWRSECHSFWSQQ